MVGTKMLYEGLVLWRVIPEGGVWMEADRKPGCGGRIRDVPCQVMRKGWDKEGTLVALPCRRSVGPGEQYNQTRGEGRKDTLVSRFTEGALSLPNISFLTTSVSQNTAEN